MLAGTYMTTWEPFHKVYLLNSISKGTLLSYLGSNDQCPVNTDKGLGPHGKTIDGKAVCVCLCVSVCEVNSLFLYQRITKIQQVIKQTNKQTNKKISMKMSSL